MRFGDRIALAALPLPFTTLGLSVFTFSGFYIPELYIAAWLFLTSISDGRRARAISKLLLYKPLAITTLSMISVSLVSGFSQEFSFVPFYGRLRALLACSTAVVTVHYLYKKYGSDNANSMLGTVCVSASGMYLLSALFVAGSEQTKASVSMICFSLASLFMAEKNRVFSTLALALLGSVAAYLSFFRQNYLSAAWNDIVSILFVTYISLYSRGHGFRISKQTWLLVAIPSAVAGTLLISWNTLSSFLNSSESRYIQSIGKLNDLFHFVQTGQMDESGSSRLSNYTYLIDQAVYYLLPNGLTDDGSLTISSIWGGAEYNAGASVVRDSIVGYSIVTFGIIISTLILVFASTRMLRSIARQPHTALTRFFFLVPPIVIYVFVDGATMTQLQKSLFFGIAIGLISLPTCSARLRKHRIYISDPGTALVQAGKFQQRKITI